MTGWPSRNDPLGTRVYQTQRWASPLLQRRVGDALELGSLTPPLADRGSGEHPTPIRDLFHKAQPWIDSPSGLFESGPIKFSGSPRSSAMTTTNLP